MEPYSGNATIYNQSLVNKSYSNNFVFYTRSDKDSISDLIDKTIEHFKKAESSFSWQISDLDYPDNIGELLLKRGFEKDSESSALYFELNDDNLPNLEKSLNGLNPSIRIEHIDRAEMLSDKMLNFISESFPMPRKDIEDMETWLTKSVESNKEMGSQNYVARNENGYLCGWAAYFTDEKSEHVMLDGATTHPDFREQGVYSSLLLTRLKEIHLLGKKSVFIDAASDTSSPILLKRGFKKLANLVNYKYIIEPAVYLLLLNQFKFLTGIIAVYKLEDLLENGVGTPLIY